MMQPFANVLIFLIKTIQRIPEHPISHSFAVNRLPDAMD